MDFLIQGSLANVDFLPDIYAFCSWLTVVWGGYLHWLCAPPLPMVSWAHQDGPFASQQGMSHGCSLQAPGLVLLFGPPAGNSEALLLGDRSPQVMAGSGLRMLGTAMPAWHLSLPPWWPPPGHSGGSVGALAGWGVGVRWEWGV